MPPKKAKKNTAESSGKLQVQCENSQSLSIPTCPKKFFLKRVTHHNTLLKFQKLRVRCPRIGHLYLGTFSIYDAALEDEATTDQALFKMIQRSKSFRYIFKFTKRLRDLQFYGICPF